MLAHCVSELVEKLERKLVFQIGFKSCFELACYFLRLNWTLKREVETNQLQVGLVELQRNPESLFVFRTELDIGQYLAGLLQVNGGKLILITMLESVCKLHHRVSSGLCKLAMQCPTDLKCFFERFTSCLIVCKFLEAESNHNELAHNFVVNLRQLFKLELECPPMVEQRVFYIALGLDDYSKV